MGHFLMMWFSDKPGKTDWLKIVGKEETKKRRIVETAVGEHSERVTEVQRFKLSNPSHSPNVCIMKCLKDVFPAVGVYF